MPTNLLDDLDVFYGELTPARAMVYARLERLESTEGLSLNGFVRGPRCFYSKTLPATFRLQDAGPGSTLLAKTVVPDPSYWSPDTPHIYDVTVVLRKGSDIIASEVRQIGFKPLGISGRFFTWEGKPWVLRGIEMPHSTIETNIVKWREHSAVLVGVALSDEQLRQASECGVMCYCSVGDRMYARRELCRLAKYPAVAITALFRQYDRDISRAAPNIVLAEPVPPVPGRIHQLQAWAQITHVFSGDLRTAVEHAKRYDIPVLMDGSLGSPSTLAEARAACDKLQADLAPYGQFAGYIV